MSDGDYIQLIEHIPAEAWKRIFGEKVEAEATVSCRHETSEPCSQGCFDLPAEEAESFADLFGKIDWSK